MVIPEITYEMYLTLREMYNTRYTHKQGTDNDDYTLMKSIIRSNLNYCNKVKLIKDGTEKIVRGYNGSVFKYDLDYLIHEFDSM